METEIEQVISEIVLVNEIDKFDKINKYKRIALLL